jgi:hypothetical protein
MVFMRLIIAAYIKAKPLCAVAFDSPVQGFYTMRLEDEAWLPV